MIKKLIITIFLFIPSLLFADLLTGKVIHVTDGDTVHILLSNNNKEKIRLAGIDAPERKQAHGKKAKQYLASMIGNKLVNVEYNKRDRYGRIVGKITYNGSDINLKMVQGGYAWHYKKYEREQVPDDRLSYAVAERNAYKHKLGLFKNEAIPPWQWRKNKKNLRKIKHNPKMQTLLSSNGSGVNVWVNLNSGKYHCPDTRYYGNTKKGKMMPESIALKYGYHGAHGLTCN